MSRSALWRQEDKVKARAAHAQDVFARAVEEGRQNSHLRGIIPLSCPDDTFNMHPMLLQNIAKSPYFHKCVDTLTDWNGLVDEIYYEVKHLEPFTAGESLIPAGCSPRPRRGWFSCFLPNVLLHLFLILLHAGK